MTAHSLRHVPHLRTLREAQGLSPAELARRARLDPKTVILLEGGYGHGGQRTTIRKLAQALGVEPRQLMGES